MEGLSFGELLRMGKVDSIRLIGDSITAGFGCHGWVDESTSCTGPIVFESPRGIHFEASYDIDCWANRLRKYVKSFDASVVNAGVCGYRYKYLATDADGWLGEGADVILVMLGTNDAPDYPLDELKDYIHAGLESARERCDCLIAVAPPDNRRTRLHNLYGLDAVERLVRDTSDELGCQFASVYDALAVETDDLNGDRLHPTTKGSLKIWSALKEQLDLSEAVMD